MDQSNFFLSSIPAVLYGEPSPNLWLYIHGKNGCKEEGLRFAQIVYPKGWQVLAIDLPVHGARKESLRHFVPWDILPELRFLLQYARQRWSQIALRATSLGCWLSMLAYSDEPLARALFVSPVLDMEQLIWRMMGWANVTEKQLEAAGLIPTTFGETLSWDYLQYVKAHPVTDWRIPTAILCAKHDALTGREATDIFAHRFGCTLTEVVNAEHWFHTPEQLALLARWENDNT